MFFTAPNLDAIQPDRSADYEARGVGHVRFHIDLAGEQTSAPVSQQPHQHRYDHAGAASDARYPQNHRRCWFDLKFRHARLRFSLAACGVTIPVTRMKALIDVFFQPGKVFSSLPERRAAWVFPLLVNLILLLASTAVTLHVLGLELITRQRLAGSSMSPDQMQRALAQGSSPAAAYITYAVL